MRTAFFTSPSWLPLPLFLLLLPNAATAAELDGGSLSVLWGIPFLGLLFSIALIPLRFAHFWHSHFGKLTLLWVLALLLPFAAAFGAQAALASVMHAVLEEYIPFVALLTALFVVAGGICVRGRLDGSPARNTALLALGAVLASFMGTTGASMLLIRPLIRANERRRHVAHIVVFFIFLVANAGGALTPLGDPPLFLGFLQGVDFFWTTRYLLPHTLFMWGSLLIIFYFLDRYYVRNQEPRWPPEPVAEPLESGAGGIRLEGKINFILLLAVIALVLMSGIWKPGAAFTVLGTPVQGQNLVRDAGLLLIILLSLWWTPRAARLGNDFGWAPMLEVGKLFAGIFITIIPVIAMLRAGEASAFAGVIRAVSGAQGQPLDLMYFWMTGLLSSFLDNAPTYLVFFNIASGDAKTLMTSMSSTLVAISAGAVFMGANSYIGNAPNMMVKAIAEERGIQMPSFLAYLVWALVVLLPLFIVMTLLFLI